MEKAKSYEVVGKMKPGDDPSLISISPKEKQAVQVSAGSPIPKGSTCVVPAERVIRTGIGITLKNAQNVIQGSYIRDMGADLKKGTLLFEKGKNVGHVEFGLLLSAGIKEVDVYRKPRVVILSSRGEYNKYNDSGRTRSMKDCEGIVLEQMVRSSGCEMV